MRAPLTLALGCLIAVALVRPLHATTVADFGVEELARLAHAGVRARVVATDSSDPAWARSELEVAEVLFGQVPSTRLVLELDARIADMPNLRTGDEIVVFLNFTNRVEKVIGLRWGTYRVQHDEVFDHEWQPLELTIETPVTHTGVASAAEPQPPREFLRRRAGSRAGSMPYAELRTVVHAVRQRLITEGVLPVSARPNGN